MTRSTFTSSWFASQRSAWHCPGCCGWLLSIALLTGNGLSVVAAELTDAREPRATAASSVGQLSSADIAVGEPLQIPLTSVNRPTTASAETRPASDGDTLPPEPPPAEAAAPDSLSPVASTSPEVTVAADGADNRRAESANPTTKPTTGWLGLTVDDSLVTGRLVIVEVADSSPAQTVGIRPQDVLLAIDGQPVQTADQLAALLSAIPPQKAVRALIGKTDGVTEVTMTSVTRPNASRSPATVALPAVVNTPVPAASRFSRPAGSTPQPQMPPAPAFEPEPVAAGVPNATASPPSRFAHAANPSPPARLPQPQASSVPASGATPPAARPQSPLTPAPLTQAAITPSVRDVPAGTGRPALGVRTIPIDLTTQSRYQLPEPRGAYVLGVIQDLPAFKAGLPPGSVIIAFDDRPVSSPDDLRRLVTGSQPGRIVAVQYVLPGGEARQTDIELKAIDPALEEALVGIPNESPTVATGTSQMAQRPLTPPAATTAAEVSLNHEVNLLRAEVGRLRDRVEQLELEQLEAGQPQSVRLRGDALR